MKKQKYYINLTDQERSEILSSLLIKKNELTHQGKFTDGIHLILLFILVIKIQSSIRFSVHSTASAVCFISLPIGKSDKP